MYLAKEMTQKSCPRSASCSAAATTPRSCTRVRKIGQHRSKDSELNHALHVLEQALKS